MRSLPVLFALLLWYPATASAAETSRLAFVTEYVREVGVNEDMRALAAREIAEPPTDKNAAMIQWQHAHRIGAYRSDRNVEGNEPEQAVR